MHLRDCGSAAELTLVARHADTLRTASRPRPGDALPTTRPRTRVVAGLRRLADRLES